MLFPGPQSSNEGATASGGKNMDSDTAMRLFMKLGVRVEGLTRREFTTEYFQLARRYHPDHTEGRTTDLMASINAARTYLERFHNWRSEEKLE
jgi:hypothetical protein